MRKLFLVFLKSVLGNFGSSHDCSVEVLFGLSSRFDIELRITYMFK